MADSSPLVLHGRGRASARLRDGVLLLESGGVRRRIPVGAIERVEVRGGKGRELAVVLTAADPARAKTYTLTARSAPAVGAFAGAVRRALPARVPGKPRADGAARVSVEPLERPGLEPWRVGLWALGVSLLLVAGLLAACGAGAKAVALWLAGAVVLGFGAVAVRSACGQVRDAVVLRRRGITVEGRLKYSFDTGSGEDRVTHHVYRYVDALGEPRERTGEEGGPDQVEIVYDPEDPEGTTKVGRGTAGQLTSGVLGLLLLAVPMAGIGAAMVVTALASLFA
ncbi:DUF3592 domain-containing protein [Streptomyces sp. NPDC001480]|uniref:DUF3592 domain-containing protein n=1 Tax=Streptomyces sp. NPDC001480 TaxID=3364577 RepID=UPI0036A5B6B7